MLQSLSSTSIDSSTLPDIDWQRLNQLAGEDADFAVELLAMFLKDSEHSLASVEEAIERRSPRALEEAVHALRGASANVGALKISAAAMQLEEMACEGQFERASSLFQQLQTHFNELRKKLDVESTS